MFFPVLFISYFSLTLNRLQVQTISLLQPSASAIISVKWAKELGPPSSFWSLCLPQAEVAAFPTGFPHPRHPG